VEARIVASLTQSLDESEARILAAIGSSAPPIDYKPPTLYQQNPVAEEQHIEVHESTITANSTSAAKAEEAKQQSRALRPQKEAKAARAPVPVNSELDYVPKDAATWTAIPGIRCTSGVSCEQSCQEAFNRVRRSATGVRYAMFDFDHKFCWIYPSREGVSTDDYETDWAEFVDQLPDGKACYAVYNFTYADAGGGGYSQAGADVEKNKTILFAWSCNKAKVKAKMVSASSASAIKQVCRGTMDCAIHDKIDMGFEDMCGRLGC